MIAINSNSCILLFLTVLQSISINTLDIGGGLEPESIKVEPPAPVPVLAIRVRIYYPFFFHSLK